MSFLPISPLCVPDAYLTAERLSVLFNEFNACLSHDVSRSSTFAHLVNSIRELYVAQILILQHDLSRPGPESEPKTQAANQPTTQHKQVTEHQHQQLWANTQGQRLEPARSGQCTPDKWVVAIDVVYGEQESQRPPNRIQELTQHGDNIHQGNAGKYVWLVPQYSTNYASALTGIDIAIQDSRDDEKCSLVRGASGKYRYIIPKSVTSKRRIYEICLLRLSYAIAGPPIGYDGGSIDINSGRGGGYLYLIWKSWGVEMVEDACGAGVERFAR